MIGNGEADTTYLLSIKQIRRDGGTQARVETDEELAKAYAEALKEGAKFPPPVVFSDGQVFWLADGFARLRAHEIAGRNDISVQIRRGTRRDAVLFSVGA